MLLTSSLQLVVGLVLLGVYEGWKVRMEVSGGESAGGAWSARARRGAQRVGSGRLALRCARRKRCRCTRTVSPLLLVPVPRRLPVAFRWRAMRKRSCCADSPKRHTLASTSADPWMTPRTVVGHGRAGKRAAKLRRQRDFVLQARRYPDCRRS